MNIIPKHDCKNCGGCCGPVPINEKEYNNIVEYIKNNKPIYNKEHGELDCKFRVGNGCSIYTVRPVLCKLMGVVKGMECANGNSKNLNGMNFMDFKSKPVGFINFVIKTDY